ncbi:hypothetical protein [Xanthocytophaga flava]|uniref:hypothetical protein n=1 Tax=Xanthocytophaga flava TaxID=3048013 RepID=UPI0028D0AB2E|nr:hypothetical protein [Xanthocytophaga flavus]MDJ1472411.1 hypothetical protein [Xanthocytophaga flavus]
MKLYLLYFPKLSFLIGCCIFFSACGLIGSKGAPNGLYLLYERSLTESEKALIKEKRTLVKGITLYDRKGNEVENGKILVEKQGTMYNFVEVGEWYVTFPKKNSLDLKTGAYHIERKYDQKGNMIAQDVFLQGKTDSLIRVRKMTSTLDTLNQKVVLIENWRVYDKNEVLTDTYSLVSPEFEKTLSDRLKPKYQYGKHVRYNPDGTIKSSKLYDLPDKVKTK